MQLINLLVKGEKESAIRMYQDMIKQRLIASWYLAIELPMMNLIKDDPRVIEANKELYSYLDTQRELLKQYEEFGIPDEEN